MADKTAIEWTDATVNFWWGCTKVGPGCDHCYAETWAKRTGSGIWGAGVPRRKIASAVKTLHRLDNGYAWWAADCQIGKLHDHSTRRVFIQSMSDLFDKEVPIEWFDEAWDTITVCDRLEIQIVTKRISFVEKRLNGKPWPKHAGLIISVVNQDEADRDIPRLLELKARLGIPWVGLSMEPLLGAVDISPWLPDCYECGLTCGKRLGGRPNVERCVECGEECDETTEPVISEGCPKCSGELEPVCPDCGHYMVYQHPDTQYLDWVIVGGESGGSARPMNPAWAKGLRDQCAAAQVPFLFKQWGEWAPAEAFGAFQHGPVTDRYGNVRDWMRQYVQCEDRADRLDAHSFTENATDLVFRVGKKRAGRRLDGALHDGFPS